MPPVTLVIKTPSLKLSDLTYSCESTSSVYQLKIHLQTQYPSKPKPEEQRLIYQGKLLRDTEVFQDFLRDLDQEQRHTLHLVYTLKRTPSAENHGQVTQNVDGTAEDGLRLRNVTPPSTTTQGVQQQTPQAEWVVTNGQFPVWANQADPVTQQLLWWQQTYAQQYWAQYMHHISNGQYLGTNTPTTVATPTPPPPPPAPEPEQPQRRAPLPAVGGVAQEEEDDGGIRVARDWLDWVYVSSRLAILLGVMYYYSSLPRFMLVTLIVAGIYLYQKALHQRRNAVVLQQRNRQVIAAQPNIIVEADGNNPEPVTPPERVQQPAAVPTTPSGFNVALNLLIGFFTSLIPEVPAPEAALN